MIKQILWFSVPALLAFASVGHAQNTLELTGTGDNAVSGGVFVSPYVGSIWNVPYSGSGPAPSASTAAYTGYIICDDFTDESYVGDIWNAIATNAASVGSNVLFTQGDNNGTTVSQQTAYDAIAWLATQLVEDPNVKNPASPDQTNYSYAIWDIMDNGAAGNPDGGATTLITAAFAAVAGGYVPGMNGEPNVTVYTPNPKYAPPGNVSQEFLVVTTPEASTLLIMAADLVGFLALVGFLRKRISLNI